jgi:hypothetical protein
LLRVRKAVRVHTTGAERAIPRSSILLTASDRGVARMDRRKALRFNLNVPVRFMWKYHGRRAESATGETRDISFRGLFVVSDACPPVGSTIKARVTLPTPGGLDLVMRLKATVLRVEAVVADKYAGGFAALTKKYALERPSEDPKEEQTILDES